MATYEWAWNCRQRRSHFSSLLAALNCKVQRSKDEAEASGVEESSEILVSREERNIPVNTGLRNQGVSQPCPAAA